MFGNRCFRGKRLRGEGFDRAHEFLAFKTRRPQRALRGDDEWRASQKGKYCYNASPYTHTLQSRVPLMLMRAAEGPN